jgi:hypothetical protein
LCDVRQVGSDKPRIGLLEILTGALRSRLMLMTSGKENAYFVVNNLSRIIDELKEMIEPSAPTNASI